MATIAGQVIGTAIGGPIGGAIGAAIGSYIDNRFILPALFPQKDVQGPRVDSIQLSFASEGSNLVRAFGPYCKNEATCIWLSTIREVSTEEEVGKGGGGQEVETLTYFCDIAFSFCDASILTGGAIYEADEVWMNGSRVWQRDANVSISSNLISATAVNVTAGAFNLATNLRLNSPVGGPDLSALRAGTNATVSGFTGGAAPNNGTYRVISSKLLSTGASEATLRNTAAVTAAASPTITVTQVNPSFDPGFASSFVFYKGDQSTTDATIVAAEGVSNVPQFRHVAYFVVNNMDLTPFGGTPPTSVSVRYKAQASATRAEVIRLLCKSAKSVARPLGLVEGTDFDVSGVTGSIDGLVIRGPQPPSAIIEQLMIAYDIQAQDRDGLLRFYDHSAVDLITVDSADLAAHEEGSDNANHNVGLRDDRYRDAPKTVIVTYVDRDNDLQNGSQNFQKVDASTQLVLSARFDLVLTAQEAQCICRRLTFQLHSQAMGMAVQLPPSYAAAIENDTLLVTTDDGVVRRMLVQTLDEGRNGLRNYEGVEDQGQTVTFDPADCTVETPDYPGSRLYVPPELALYVMDIPPLLDSHAQESGLYWAGCPFDTDAIYAGAALFETRDAGGTFTQVDSHQQRSTMGQATTALAAPADAFVFDAANSVTISLLHGSLESRTLDEVLAGANRGYLGGEIIGWTTAVLNGDGTYTLSGLLRGLMDTDDEVTGHVVGDAFVHLNAPGVERVNRPQSTYGLTVTYELVPTGGALSDFDSQDVGRVLGFATLRPFAPTAVRCVRDTATNDIEITWARRTRIPYFTLSGNPLPEDEATRRYDVLVYTASHATLKRTTEVVDAETLVYTSAQQTTDGFTPGAFTSLALDLFQKNPTVGRSKRERVTVTIENT